MILKPLKDVHPGAGWNTPQMKSSGFGYSATEYYNVTQQIETSFRSSPHFHTLVGNMHLSIELAAKAIATKTEPSFNPKQYGHRSTQIINDYANRINVFQNIKADDQKMQLIEQLQNGFVGMRYGEMYMRMDGNDSTVYRNIFIELIEFLHSITGLRFLPHHSSTGSSY